MNARHYPVCYLINIHSLQLHLLVDFRLKKPATIASKQNLILNSNHYFCDSIAVSVFSYKSTSYRVNCFANL